MTHDEYKKALDALVRALLLPTLQEMFAKCDESVIAGDIRVTPRLLLQVILVSEHDITRGPGAAPPPSEPPAAQAPPRRVRKPSPLAAFIVQVLDAARGPMSLDAVEEELRQRGSNADRSTIYRNLERLVTAGVICKARGGGYELPPE